MIKDLGKIQKILYNLAPNSSSSVLFMQLLISSPPLHIPRSHAIASVLMTLSASSGPLPALPCPVLCLELVYPDSVAKFSQWEAPVGNQRGEREKEVFC